MMAQRSSSASSVGLGVTRMTLMDLVLNQTRIVFVTYDRDMCFDSANGTMPGMVLVVSYSSNTYQD